MSKRTLRVGSWNIEQGRTITAGAVVLMLLASAGCRPTPEEPAAPPAPAAVAEKSAAVPRSAVEPLTFEGICDGSAAVDLGDGTLLVAYDELNTLFAFAASGGRPTARRDVGSMLALAGSSEMDLEGAAVAGGQIWWIGSHGLDGDGEEAPNRRVLFATGLPAANLEDLAVERAPIDLTETFLASAEVAEILTPEVRARPPKEGGLNIEGLAAAPDGGLVVGFRSPLSAADGMTGTALVVTLRPEGDVFAVDRSHRLDLGDRGVRDLARSGDGYVIVAGPVDPGGSFALYVWDGDGEASKIADLDELNAEAILDMGDHYLVMSDDGKVKRDDEEAGDGSRGCDKIRKENARGEEHPNVFFRAQRIPKAQ